MRKRYKKSYLGLNPEWFKRYLLMPVMILLSIIMVSFTAFYKFDDFISKRKETKLILEKQKAQKKLYETQQKIKKLEDEKRKKVIEEQEILRKQKEIENRRINIEFQNKVMAKDWPKGTYVHNKINGAYGIVDHCEIPNVITKEGWFFEVNDMEDGFKNKDIEYASYKEWYNYSQKKLKSKKLTPQEKNKLNKIIEEQNAEMTRYAKKLYPPNPKFGYAKYDGDYYYVTKWNGLILTLRHHRNRKNIFLAVIGDEKLSPVPKGEMRWFYIVKKE